MKQPSKIKTVRLHRYDVLRSGKLLDWTISEDRESIDLHFQPKKRQIKHRHTPECK